LKFKNERDERSDRNNSKVDNIVQTESNIKPAESDMNINVQSAPMDGGEVKKVSIPNERTKTHQAAEVVTGSSNSAVSAGGTTLMRGIVFGGGAGTEIGKDVSATTKAEDVYRSGSRTGKRVDPITRKIDFNYPEQVEIEYRQSKPLSETTEKQGYNGEYMNEHAIVQRVSGGSPADPMFNRSVDEIALDMGYFTEGQYNNSLNSYDEFKVDSYDPSTGTYSPISDKKGNYQIQDLEVTINKKGAVGFNWIENDLSNRDLDEATMRTAGDAALRMVNLNERDRLTIVAKAGNESDPSWSALGDSIRTSSAVNHYLREIDGYAGDNIFMSKRKLNEALAYAVNKSGKDGIRVTGPMAELVNGNIEGDYSSALKSISEANGRDFAFNPLAYVKGGAGLWLAINDSLTKYTTKGKMLSMPLSFKNACNIADANDGVFRMHEGLFNDVKHCELFSTIDAPYDPFRPVVMTDKASLIHPLSAAATGNITINKDTTLADNVVPTIFTYHYENMRNKYNIPVKNFFIEGLHRYFVANAQRIISALRIDSSTYAGYDSTTQLYTIRIPVQSSTTSLSLWDLIVCSAVPYMVTARQETMVDVIKYQNDFGYPYTGLVALKDIDVNEAINYSFIDKDTGLATKVANPVDAIKVKFPELFWSQSCKAYDDEKLGGGHGFMATHTVLPHYFSQNQFAYDSDKLLRLSDDASCMSYPTTRSGVNLTDMDAVYGMSEEDYRLALDRMVVYPGYTRASNGVASGDDKGPHVFKANWITTGTNHYEVDESYTYKYGATTDGIPVLPYLATAESADEYDRCLTILDVMKTPREMGLHFVMPAGVLTPVRDGSTGKANYRNVSSGYLAVSGPGFTAYIWHIAGKNMQSSILQANDVNITRSAAYMNNYEVIQAIPTNAINDFGAVLTCSRGLKATATAHTFTLDSGSFDFVPFVSGSYGPNSYDAANGTYAGTETQVTSTNNEFNVIGFHKYFWTRIQRLPFVFNPFDANASDLSYVENKQQGNKYDPNDYMYIFDFCGFRASDYHECTMERNRQRIALGMNYINDPYIDKTMLLK